MYESRAHNAITAPNFCGINATIISILDIGGECIVDPLTDGHLPMRAMMGLTGAAVTNNVIARALRLYINQQFVANYLP